MTQLTTLTDQQIQRVFENQKTQTRALALDDLHKDGDISNRKYIREIENLRDELKSGKAQ